ncbi:MAG TPA: type I 3-dehydroquinate dehydratase [Casimicrobiaceae bacterium]|nr:type I 3-dehydroquinate dehydratase [Casimicrobiaceae bacterium]
MTKAKPITLHGKPVAAGVMPVICTPLVGRDREAVLAEAATVLPKRPDVLEWRVDFFDRLEDTGLVIDTARALKATARHVPLLFTRRAHEEGGQRVALSEPRVVQLYEAVCAARCVDLIDYELSHPGEAFARLREASRRHEIAMVGSYHNFQATPPAPAMVATFRDAQSRGADVGKVAVMPGSPSDVLALLAATFEASNTLEIPLISMSMGPVGSVSRMVGGVFGSALTFAVGKASSAPGQVPIEDLRAVLAAVHRATGM